MTDELSPPLMSHYDPDEIFDYCDLCGAPLDADNCYGTDEFPLCSDHKDKVEELLKWLLEKTTPTGQMIFPI